MLYFIIISQTLLGLFCYWWRWTMVTVGKALPLSWNNKMGAPDMSAALDRWKTSWELYHKSFLSAVQYRIYYCLSSSGTITTNCGGFRQANQQGLPYCCSGGCCGLTILVRRHLRSCNSHASFGSQRGTGGHGEGWPHVFICRTSHYSFGTYTRKNGSLGGSCVKVVETSCQ